MPGPVFVELPVHSTWGEGPSECHMLVPLDRVVLLPGDAGSTLVVFGDCEFRCSMGYGEVRAFLERSGVTVLRARSEAPASLRRWIGAGHGDG